MATDDDTTGCRACCRARLHLPPRQHSPCSPNSTPIPSAPPTCASVDRRGQWRVSALLVGAAFLLLLLDCPTLARGDRMRQKGKICVVPRFLKLPPPITYTDPSLYPKPKFQCKAFPSNAGVVFLQIRPKESLPVILSRPGSGTAYGSASYPIASSAMYPSAETDFYCRANTECGHLISRPFRVVPASIFSYSDKEPSVTVSFFKGNVAQVQCSIPQSAPAAQIDFLKDSVTIGHSDRYLVTRQPGMSWVALLIRDFSQSDVGNYTCKATNPVSQKVTQSKAVTRLTMQKASAPFEVRFHKDYPYQNPTQRLTVREGENVTLYCLPEGAPIPTVKWFQVSSNNALMEAGVNDKEKYLNFGAMMIPYVRPSHSSTYTCSVTQRDRQISRTFTLKVIQRLKIRVPPQDVTVEKIGAPQKMMCEADGGEGEITISWYFNAQLIDPNHKGTYEIEDSALKIVSVTTDLLGIYQCVARTDKEWTSASAVLVQKGDVLRRGNTQTKYRVINSTVGITAAITCKMQEKESPLYNVRWYKDNVRLDPTRDNRFMPMVLPPDVFLNLMIAQQTDSGLYNCRFYDKITNQLVKQDFVQLVVRSAKDSSGISGGGWGNKSPPVNPVDPNRGRGKPGLPPGGVDKPSRPSRRKPKKSLGLARPNVEVVFDNLAVSVNWSYTGEGEVQSYTVLYREKVTRSPGMYALDKKVNSKWSSPKTLRNNYMENKIVVTSEYLKPGWSYKFRVIANLREPIKGHDRVKSRWSAEADFYHIFPDKPALTRAKAMTSHSVRLSWRFESPHKGISPTEFVVTYREKRNQIVDRYVSKTVKGGDIRSATVDGLKAGTLYEFLVYGVKSPDKLDLRRITLFSNTMEVRTLPPTMLPPGAEKAENNRVTFLVMGCVAGLLIVIVAVLMSACLWKQRQEKRRMRDESMSMIYTSEFPSHYPSASSALQAALNGTSIDKDPKFLVPGTNSASSQLLLSNLGDGAVWQQQQQHQQTHGAPPLPHPRLSAANGGLRINPEGASLLMNYDERFTALPPPLPPTGAPAGYFGNGTLRQSMYATRGVEDPLYATRLHPAYAVTSPVGGIYPLPAPLGGPPGRFSPYAVAMPPMNNGDGAESVYSYFSQQEAGTHTDGATPYSASNYPANHAANNYNVLLGSRTVDRPRHHRRKRRRPANTSCSQSGLESGSETGPPHMKDMAVNTDMSSSDAIYESSLQASTTASPPPRMGALMMGGLSDLHTPPAAGPQAYKSPPGGPEMPAPPPPAAVAALSTPLTSVASSSPSSSSGPPSSHTLTRRPAPNLFLDPPRLRDFTEYGVSPEPV